MTTNVNSTPDMRLALLGASLNADLSENIRQRDIIERRWVEDIRQYYGHFEGFGNRITDDKDSPGNPRQRGFNRTRIKVNTGAGRLGDLLFPGNDKNWGIKPSPVPETLDRLANETPVVHNGQTFQDEQGNDITEADVAAREMEISDQKCRKMELLLQDQLNSCNYGNEGRMMLMDSAMLGTGILKGPFAEGRTKKAWRHGPGGPQLVVLQDMKPAVRRVSPWNFVPDMAAVDLASCDRVFERLYLTRPRMPTLVSKFGFNPKALERILSMSPGSTATATTQSFNELRAMTGLQAANKDNRYEIWLVNGYVDTEFLLDIGAAMPEAKSDRFEDAYPAVVWMCGGEILKMTVSPLDTGDLPYSTFVWEPDEASIFGFGIPFLTRNSQENIDTATHHMMQNARFSAGPQVVYRKGIVVPTNGKYELEPFKTWEAQDKTGEARHAFETYDIPNNQNNYAALIKDLGAMMDEESLIPVLAHGEQGIASDTLGGMAMLMNASLTTVRAQAKRWDDNVTIPLLNRFYDWNMLNHDDDSVKGDFEIEATGSTTLLAREIIGRQLFEVLRDFGNHPTLSAWTKVDELYKQYIATTYIKPESIVRSQAEYDAYIKQQQDAAQEQAQNDPRVMAMQLKRMALEVESEKTRSQEATMLFEMRMKNQISERQFEVEMEALNKRLNADLYKFQTEAKIKMATGKGI